jgi:hypothetical protein
LPLNDGPRHPIVFGLMKGEFTEVADFDAPLPDEVLAQFEGRT